MAITTLAELETAVQNLFDDTAELSSARIDEHVVLAEADMRRDLRCREMEADVGLVMRAAQAGGTAGGTANAITVTVSGLTSLLLGTTITFTAAATNTGATTLNPSGLGATNIRKVDGTVALEANDIVSGFDYRAYYDGTQFRLVKPGAVPLPSRWVGNRSIYIDGDPKKRSRYLAPDNFWLRYLASETGEPAAHTIEGEYIIFGPASDSARLVILNYYRWPGALSVSNVPILFTNHPDLYLYGTARHTADYLEDNAKVLKYEAKFKDIVESIMRGNDRDRMGDGALEALSDVSGE